MHKTTTATAIMTTTASSPPVAGDVGVGIDAALAAQQANVLDILNSTKIPQTRKRPNILYDSPAEYTSTDTAGKRKWINGIRKCQSMTFGVYKKRFVKDPPFVEFLANARYPALYEAMRVLIQTYDPAFQYDSITVNKNVVCKRHTDSSNKAKSYILFLGDYTGGELLNDDGEVFATPGVFYRFDGSVPHWNKPIGSGTKYTIIYFQRY